MLVTAFPYSHNSYWIHTVEKSFKKSQALFLRLNIFEFSRKQLSNLELEQILWTFFLLFQTLCTIVLSMTFVLDLVLCINCFHHIGFLQNCGIWFSSWWHVNWRQDLEHDHLKWILLMFLAGYMCHLCHLWHYGWASHTWFFNDEVQGKDILLHIWMDPILHFIRCQVTLFKKKMYFSKYLYLWKFTSV